MTKIPNSKAETEAALSPTERRARISALQAELEALDTVRDGVRNVLRELHGLQRVLDANPLVGGRLLHGCNVEACDSYAAASARLSSEIVRLDRELTVLCQARIRDRVAAAEAVNGRIVDSGHVVAVGGVR